MGISGIAVGTTSEFSVPADASISSEGSSSMQIFHILSWGSSRRDVTKSDRHREMYLGFAT
jgi:hypothetical protein